MLYHVRKVLVILGGYGFGDLEVYELLLYARVLDYAADVLGKALLHAFKHREVDVYALHAVSLREARENELAYLAQNEIVKIVDYAQLFGNGYELIGEYHSQLLVVHSEQSLRAVELSVYGVGGLVVDLEAALPQAPCYRALYCRVPHYPVKLRAVEDTSLHGIGYGAF